MNSQIILGFIFAFFFWMFALALNLILLIRPKFIFRKSQPGPQTNLVVIAFSIIMLLMSSFILGVMTFLMRALNSIVIF